MVRATVIGGGLMGCGIAQTFAAAGFPVAVCEPDAEVRGRVRSTVSDGLSLLGLDAGAASHVEAYPDIGAAVAEADFVIEAAPERLELKRTIFRDLERLAPGEAILASNSSVIPITRIAEGCATAHRMVGAHWWNPAPLIPLVEVIQGAATSDAIVETTMLLMRRLGKTPAHVRKDTPGFVGNRLQHALWREAIAMVAEGVCDAATLDQCVKNSFGLRLAVLGPLENADLVGLDLTQDIHRVMMPELDRSDRPHPYLDALVAGGRLGFKSGEGFRAWTNEDKAAVRARLASHLIRALRERNASHEGQDLAT